MKKKKNLLTVVVIILFILSVGVYLYLDNKEYKYICFNIEITKETLIIEEYLEECISNKRIPKGVITEKEELLTEDIFTSYKQIKESYKIGEMLYEDDFILYESPRATESDIELLNEVEVMNLGSSAEEPIKYKIYVKENEVYAINLNTGEDKVIFDIEKVSNIAVRPLCCAGNGELLILTTNGNAYISEKDCNYSFGFDFPFKKLEAKDIVGFKLIPTNDGDWTKNLYGINSIGEEILLQKLN